MVNVTTIISMNELYDELEKRGMKVNREWKEKIKDDTYIRKRNKKGYIQLEQKIVWEEYYGKIPEGYILHHKNLDKKDNRIENLQLVTFQEHMKIHKEIRKNAKK